MLTNYEKEVIELLGSDVLSPRQIDDVINRGEFIGYDYTGSGYFLSIHHPGLPKGRTVCDKPILMGEADGIVCGFIVFIEDGRLTIECDSWGEIEVPEDFRSKTVEIKSTPLD